MNIAIDSSSLPSPQPGLFTQVKRSMLQQTIFPERLFSSPQTNMVSSSYHVNFSQPLNPKANLNSPITSVTWSTNPGNEFQEELSRVAFNASPLSKLTSVRSEPVVTYGHQVLFPHNLKYGTSQRSPSSDPSLLRDFMTRTMKRQHSLAHSFFSFFFLQIHE